MEKTRLDNLVPLRTRLNEWQFAGWQPSRVAEEGLGCNLLADQMIPMADGTRLSADVYTPLRPGRYPAIVSFAAYNRDLHTAGVPTGTNEIGAPPIFADRGYVHIVITARGVGRSEGALQPFLCEAQVDDHLACVEWAAEQDWCDGNVCLFGTSYYGMTQVSIAVRRPPMLRAFFCNEICTDYRRQLMRYGGQFNADFLSLWIGANFTRGAMRRRVPPLLRAILSHLVNRRFVWDWLVAPRIDRIMNGFKTHKVAPEAMAIFTALMTDDDSALTHPFWFGPYRDLDRIEVPFVVVQNRGNIALHQFGAYELFERAGTPPAQRRLIVGPAEFVLPVYSWQLEALAFFDHVVKGIDNGYDAQPRVRYWRDGAGDWGGADDFPPAEAERGQLYLAADETLSETPPQDGTARWLAVPRGIAILPGIEPQQVSFNWTVPETFELLGAVTLQLRFASNEIDSYIVARLDRIDRDGKRHSLAMGHLRAAQRRIAPELGSRNEIALDTHTLEPLTPNQPVTLRFSLTPAAALLRAGETLRLAIASRTDLLWLRPSEGFIAPDVAAPPFFARNTIFFGADSLLEIYGRSVETAQA